MDTNHLIAHDIAAEPELYNRAVIIGHNVWECLGYSKTGKTIRFARLVETDNHKLRQIDIWVNPELPVKLE